VVPWNFNNSIGGVDCGNNRHHSVHALSLSLAFLKGCGMAQERCDLGGVVFFGDALPSGEKPHFVW